MIGYLAPEGLENLLEKELNGISLKYGRLFLLKEPQLSVRWVQNIWEDVEILPFQSISEAANLLRARGALWSYYPLGSFRRSELIKERLPFFSKKPIPFLSAPPKGPLGSWTLIDENTLLVSAKCSSPYPNGELHFLESKIPPSRAYLKLWEFFTRFQMWPQKGESCLEIGASPGSWTWVLEGLGAQVTAVDRAPLAPFLSKLPSITFLKRDAFGLNSSDYPKLDWLFSDLICYPEKLFCWLQPWIERDISLVCTLKFQEGGDYQIIEKFASIPHSGLIHLYHNKHELTWYRFKK